MPRSAVAVAFVLVAGLLGLGCGAVPSGSEQPGRTVSANDEVTVGEISWRVLYVRRTPYIDKRFTGATRAKKGMFIVLEMRAERRSQRGSITPKPLAIVDKGDREYRVDDSSKLALDESGLRQLQTANISPRTPVQGWVAFDVPPDASGLRLKVLDMEGSGNDYAYVRLP